ncbi:two-component system, OmpR family, response regulator VanR [Enterococcus sp. AZ194]|uniref:VanR-ABDEGLN family response regulator transcription factor n=1 Tax=Enterococcus sp. AZ194 TaxID=2774629 RepID=UPI003F2967B7
MVEKILIVDDEEEIADLLEVYLKGDGYEIKKFYRGQEALACVEKERFDLAVLDVMLPDIDGFKMVQKIRERHFFPIIMLTAKVEDLDKITGLTLGADDYITKPFNPLEVVARIKTQLRRFRKYNAKAEVALEETTQEIDLHGLVINQVLHTTSLYGEKISLTPLEFSILWYLAERRGQVVPAEQLFEEVWGEKYLENNNNTVMAHIGRLREKLKEPPRKPKFIKTVWGVGYKVD